MNNLTDLLATPAATATLFGPAWTDQQMAAVEKTCARYLIPGSRTVAKGDFARLLLDVRSDPEVVRLRGCTPTEGSLRHVIRDKLKILCASQRNSYRRLRKAKKGWTLLLLKDDCFQGEWPINEDQAQTLRKNLGAK